MAQGGAFANVETMFPSLLTAKRQEEVFPVKKAQRGGLRFGVAAKKRKPTTATVRDETAAKSSLASTEVALAFFGWRFSCCNDQSLAQSWRTGTEHAVADDDKVVLAKGFATWKMFRSSARLCSYFGRAAGSRPRQGQLASGFLSMDSRCQAAREAGQAA
eukprot:TRINITY_DN12198_c0_g1_i2.p1 TRINITY_DN12198_c0_g1~~TRINITY_DN12198_c0_g1_i2.p1  ORF type:complete len:160 (+),score=31.90 TRINITY_DN12198_c0_g1_i2:73-552(+)